MDIRVHEPMKYNQSLAEALKEIPEFEKPEWVSFVKSSTSRTKPSSDPDFWYRRAASILRQMHLRGIVGVQRLRTRYGSRKDRGMKPAEFRRSGGKIIRLILQQAEKAGFAEKVKEKKSGRKLTEKGREFLENIGEKK